jgi:hypothetical protein
MSKKAEDCVRTVIAAAPMTTKFVTKEQAVALVQIHELALEDLNKVSGGQMSAPVCIECCGHSGIPEHQG